MTSFDVMTSKVNVFKLFKKISQEKFNGFFKFEATLHFFFDLLSIFSVRISEIENNLFHLF